MSDTAIIVPSAGLKPLPVTGGPNVGTVSHGDLLTVDVDWVPVTMTTGDSAGKTGFLLASAVGQQPDPPPPPVTQGIALGATIKDPAHGGSVAHNSGLLEWYAGQVGKMPAIVNAGGGGAIDNPFDTGLANYVHSKGCSLMWAMMATGPCSQVTNGTFDAGLRRFAQAAKAWGHPLYLRFCHEMNGNWYPYGTKGGHNGNSAASYVAMWRHVHDIFQAEGARNVQWVWCVNIDYSGATPYDQLYPNDLYVDWVALDGYDKGYGTSLESVFTTSYNLITKLTDKPLMITETGCFEKGGTYKADWIKQGFLNVIPKKFPKVRAVLWFNWDFTSEGDYRVTTSASALAAWKTVTASPLYQGSLP